MASFTNVADRGGQREEKGKDPQKKERRSMKGGQYLKVKKKEGDDATKGQEGVREE